MHNNYTLSLDKVDTPEPRSSFVDVNSREEIVSEVTDYTEIVKNRAVASVEHSIPRRGYDVVVLGNGIGVVDAETLPEIRVPGYVGDVSACNNSEGRRSKIHLPDTAPRMHCVTDGVGPKAIDAYEMSSIDDGRVGKVSLNSGDCSDVRFNDVVKKLTDALKTRFETESRKSDFEIGDEFRIELRELGIGGRDFDNMNYSVQQEPFAVRRAQFVENLEVVINENLSQLFKSGEKNVLFEVEIEDGELVVSTSKPAGIDVAKRFIDQKSTGFRASVGRFMVKLKAELNR